MTLPDKAPIDLTVYTKKGTLRKKRPKQPPIDLTTHTKKGTPRVRAWHGGVPVGHQHPHVWKSGPDPLRHEQYQKWLQQRNQAQWRGEEWELTFEQWLAAWGDNYHLRGRETGQYSMTRINRTLGWSHDNVMLIERTNNHGGKARS